MNQKSFLYLYFSFSLCLVSSEEILILDNFKYGGLTFGSEDVVVDYASLASDPKGELPNTFTICSSVHVKFVTTCQYFFQLYQEDGEPWFYLKIDPVRDLTKFTEIIRMGFNGSVHNFFDVEIPIVPHSWYHACTGLDTVSGHLRVVLNGLTVVDKVIESFRDSSQVKPKSLIGKITIFKTSEPGYWYQARGILSNMNVFGSLVTIKDMVLISTSMDCAREGDYLAWRDMEWNITGRVDTVETVDKEMELCHRESSNIVLFTDIFVKWEECMMFCPKMQRARSPLIETTEQSLAVRKTVKKIVYIPGTDNKYPGVESFAFWISITDSETEGAWSDYYSNKQVDIPGAISGEWLDGGTTENCGMMLLLWPGWQDWACHVNKAHPLQCACQTQGQMFLTLRGLCHDSNIDQYFVPRNKNKDGQTVFYGISRTVIEYHQDDALWHLSVVGIEEKTVATTEASKVSFLLGSHIWTVTHDNKDCFKGKPYKAILKLSGCQETEFTCHDGQCIRMEERCDQIVHCRDTSDENECHLILFKGGYNKKVSPFTFNHMSQAINPIHVNVSTSLMNVIEISEVNHIIRLKFGLTLEWYENRVDYHNLKQNEALNTLSDNELEDLWIPYIIFQNTDSNEAVTIEGIRSTVFVTRESYFKRSSIQDAEEIEIFGGADNKLTMSQTYSKKFHCTYLLHFFPFDTQVCYAHMKLEKFYYATTQLVPDMMVMETNTELPQYYIQSWHLKFMNSGNVSSGLKMEIIFKRRLTNELLTTYLPSFLLIMIVYSTIFLKRFFFEAALVVNLTVMLVITTLFISVMEKLPPTSYVRMVDIWLICGQLIPFVEVMLLTLRELYEDQEELINHHGESRRISSAKTTQVAPVFTLVGVMETSQDKDYLKNNDEPRKNGRCGKMSIPQMIRLAERKVVPGMVVVFATIYWTLGALFYLDVITNDPAL